MSPYTLYLWAVDYAMIISLYFYLQFGSAIKFCLSAAFLCRELCIYVYDCHFARLLYVCLIPSTFPFSVSYF